MEGLLIVIARSFMALLNMVLMIRSRRIRGLYPEIVPLRSAMTEKLSSTKLKSGLFALQFGNAVGIAGTDDASFVVELIFRVAVNRAGTGVNVALHLGFLRHVREIRRRGGIENEILARRELRHGIVGQTGQEHDLVVGFQIFLSEVEDVFAENTDLAGQVIAEPEEVDDIDLVASVEEFRNQDGANVTSAAGDKKFHKFLLEILELRLLLSSENCQTPDELAIAPKFVHFCLCQKAERLARAI